MNRFFHHLLVIALLTNLVVSAAMAKNTLAPSTLAAWVQYTAEGVEARAVVLGECPQLISDGSALAMTVRVAPDDDHPNTVCTAVISGQTKQLSLQGQRLPLPEKNPERIVVLGDTGCRVSGKHGLYQACNNNSLWPFRQVAKSVAAYDPQLIIYTGDYIYREAACPKGNHGCAGTPYGDNQATWQADWLQPARPIQLAAPLVLIRGNHESCRRAGRGWFRYLAPREYPGKCLSNTAPWTMKIGAQTLAVLDTATVKDARGKSLAPQFAEQLRGLKQQLGAGGWLASHRTFWGFGADDDSGKLSRPTKVLQNAVRMAGLPENTQLLIGAHIHLAEIIAFANQRPPQLVVANGGTQLVSRVTPPKKIDGVAIETSRVIYQYGFVVMEAQKEGGWVISFRDVEGREIEQCQLQGKNLSC